MKIGANRVASIESFTIDTKQNTEDVTELDPDDALKKFLEKLTVSRELSGSIEANFNPTDTNGQKAILQHVFGTGADTVELIFLPKTGVSITVDVILSSNVKVPKSGAVKATYNFESTGKPTLSIS
mgnify:CR=1 FL=1